MASAREARLYHRLQLASHAVAKGSDRRMADVVGLSTAQVSVLTVVAQGGTVTQRHVARALGVNESAVTSMVGRLERLGCLTRERDATDRRTSVLGLTPEGREALTRARGAFAWVNATIDRTLSSEEVDVLASALERLAAAFERQPTSAAGGGS